MKQKTAWIFMLGSLAGFVAAKLSLVRKPVGCLRVDQSDPDEAPYLFLELNQDVDMVRRQKTVLLSVENKDFLPRN